MIYLLPLIWLDRYDPEPLWLLSLAFAWGALVAVIASFIINTLVTVVIVDRHFTSCRAGRWSGSIGTDF